MEILNLEDDNAYPGRRCACARNSVARLLSHEDRAVVADDVKHILQSLDIETLNTRAGYRPGRSYIHPAEAASEILDEAVQPFLDDLHRRARLGMRRSASTCPHPNSATACPIGAPCWTDCIDVATRTAVARAHSTLRGCLPILRSLPSTVRW